MLMPRDLTGVVALMPGSVYAQQGTSGGSVYASGTGTAAAAKRSGGGLLGTIEHAASVVGPWCWCGRRCGGSAADEHDRVEPCRALAVTSRSLRG